MSQLDPTGTTPRDIVDAALVECGAFGQGQTPMAVDITDAQARLQWMLHQWARERLLVMHLDTLVLQASGKHYYTVGDGQDFDTGAGSVRPSKVLSAFLRQDENSEALSTAQNIDGIGYFVIGVSAIKAGGALSSAGENTNAQAIDFQLEILTSREDYNRVLQKGLGSQALAVYYEPHWPAGRLYVWPIASALYSIGISFPTQLPNNFVSANLSLDIPYEYYNAIMFNLAVNLRAKYRISTWPGDSLINNAKQSLALVRSTNWQMPRLRMPTELAGRGGYNVFGDYS